MTNPKYRQRGEGKIGCLVSLAVLVVAGALTFKLLPVYYNDNQLKDYAEDMCLRAAGVPAATVERQIKAKASELDIQEAVAPGAIKVGKSGESSGTCHVTLRYTRKVNLYGIATWPVVVERTISKPFGIPDT